MAANEQTEKAFQKQSGISLGSLKGKVGKKSKKQRFVREVGLGFKVPEEARTGTYIDKKCPFTGEVSIRGRIYPNGIVKSTKMKNTIIVRRNYIHLQKKYNRYEKRHSNTPTHISPCFRVNVGDIVTIGQCRPISKTVRFNVLRVERVSAANQKQFGGH